MSWNTPASIRPSCMFLTLEETCCIWPLWVSQTPASVRSSLVATWTSCGVGVVTAVRPISVVAKSGFGEPPRIVEQGHRFAEQGIELTLRGGLARLRPHSLARGRKRLVERVRNGRTGPVCRPARVDGASGQPALRQGDFHLARVVLSGVLPHGRRILGDLVDLVKGLDHVFGELA